VHPVSVIYALKISYFMWKSDMRMLMKCQYFTLVKRNMESYLFG
jgi:hypothetical protein